MSCSVPIDQFTDCQRVARILAGIDLPHHALDQRREFLARPRAADHDVPSRLPCL